MKKRSVWSFLLGFCATLTLVSFVSAEMVIVHLTGGGTLRGDLAKVDDDYSLRTDDGLLTLKASEVERVEPLPKPDLKTEYEQRRSAVAANDVEGHADVLVWLIEAEAWELAFEQCQLIMRRRPSHRLANRWLPRIKSKLGLDQNQKRALTPEEIEEAKVPLPQSMSAPDINRIRLLELTNPNEIANPPRMRVRNAERWEAINAQIAAVIARDDDEEQTRTKAYLASSNAEKLFTLAQLSGTEFTNDIEVVGDPGPLRIFRQSILPLVRETCARSGCHAPSGRAGGFRLPRTSGVGDRGAYAAFYQLTTMQTQAGPLINRDSPKHSGLIQFMLPRDIAAVPHPELPAGERISPPFNKPSDPFYRMLIEWIRSLNSPQPEYDLTYQLPE